MNTVLECFRSVEDVWAVWILCILALSWSLRRVFKNVSLQQVRAAFADERGGTYVLPYMLTFPIYMLVMCLMIQSTMILMVKMFSMQAASATVRSAVVWRSAHPYDHRKGGDMAVERAHYAAAIAMTPVASSQQRHMTNPLLNSDIFFKTTDLPWAILRENIYRYSTAAYQRTYRSIARDNIRRDRVRSSEFIRFPNEVTPDRYADRKMRYAAYATRVEVDTDKKYNQWNKEFTIELTYLMPMNIPGAGRLLGQFHGFREYHSRLIITKAAMPMETPKSNNRFIGIGYDPSMLR